MSKGNTTENEMLKVQLLSNFDPSWRTNANLYLALHTADPGEAGTQSTSEISYTNYARVAVAKSASGWTITGASAVNAALIQFAQCGAGAPQTATHWSLGTADSGAGQIVHYAALNTPLPVSELIQPQFAAGALTITED